MRKIKKYVYIRTCKVISRLQNFKGKRNQWLSLNHSTGDDPAHTDTHLHPKPGARGRAAILAETLSSDRAKIHHRTHIHTPHPTSKQTKASARIPVHMSGVAAKSRMKAALCIMSPQNASASHKIITCSSKGSANEMGCRVSWQQASPRSERRVRIQTQITLVPSGKFDAIELGINDLGDEKIKNNVSAL